MTQLQILPLTAAPDLLPTLAAWFHDKWGIPYAAYEESMTEALSGQAPVPAWYAVLDRDRVIGGAGIIANDFHDRPDLTPNLCALYIEPDYRGRGLAGMLLEYICADMKEKGISTLYLLTDHTALYERYGWEFYCLAQGDGEDQPSRMYRRDS